MESNWLLLDCTVCSAPLHTFEYARHLKACVRIKLSTVTREKQAWKIHEEDQYGAFVRNQKVGLWTPGKDPLSQ